MHCNAAPGLEFWYEAAHTNCVNTNSTPVQHNLFSSSRTAGISIFKTPEPVAYGSGKLSGLIQWKSFKPLSNSISWSIHITYLPLWFLIRTTIKKYIYIENEKVKRQGCMIIEKSYKFSSKEKIAQNVSKMFPVTGNKDQLWTFLFHLDVQTV